MSRFRFDVKRAYQAVVKMLSQSSRVNIHTVMRAAYFADAGHMAEHGRPIIGGHWRPMGLGPVNSELYELLEGALLQRLELGVPSLPWKIRQTDGTVVNVAGTPFDERVFTNYELRRLEAGIDRAFRGDREFGPAYRAALDSGADFIDYAGMAADMEALDAEQIKSAAE